MILLVTAKRLTRRLRCFLEKVKQYRERWTPSVSNFLSEWNLNNKIIWSLLWDLCKHVKNRNNLMISSSCLDLRSRRDSNPRSRPWQGRMFGRYTTGPVLFSKRAVVYHAHYCMSISICPIMIKCRICRCHTAWIMDIHKVAFMCPIEKPVRISYR